MSVTLERKIAAKLSEAAVLEQLAEEAAEFGQAALKAARVLRGENPTPVTIEEAFEHLREEKADLYVCLRVLLEIYGARLNSGGIEEEKIKRWAARIEQQERRI